MKNEGMKRQDLLFGLIGFPLSHSFSKKYFTQKFEQESLRQCRYELFPIRHIDELPSLVAANPDLAGLNVTLPHKKTVFGFLDVIHEEALAVGAVNTIRLSNGRLEGFNTDVFGFEKSLTALLGDAENRPGMQALVLGAGGAASAVAFVLKKRGIPFRLVSRSGADGSLTYSQLTWNIVAAYPLIVNTTPLGMYPHTESFPDLPYEAIGPGHFVFDLVYNPEQTIFLKKAKANGARTCNGLQMLYLQADRAWEIWNGDF